MEYTFSKYFKKRLAKQSETIQNKFFERLDVFSITPFHTILHNHSLHGKYQGFRSINISGDMRVVFQQNNGFIVFEDIGTHSELYK
jgi:addiction module RelE/StbE family toxin